MPRRAWIFLRRILRPFRRLQWKLTLVYTLLTVVTILVLQVIGLAAARAFASRHPIDGPTLVERLSKRAPEVVPHLQRIPLDRRAVGNLLQGMARPRGTRYLFGAGKGVVLPAASAIMAAVDARGELVAAIPPTAMALNPLLTSAGNRALRAALAGEDDPARLSYRTGDDGFVAAFPVRGERGAVLGALLLAVPRPPGLTGLLIGILSWRNAVLITSVAGLIGALFGFSTARWLTRRLHTLAAATEAWGRGDFSKHVPDEAGDELGDLGRKLNSMAAQLPGLLNDRERLAVLEERSRLARELHDSVTQGLYGVKLYAKAAERRFATGEIKAAARHLRVLYDTAEHALREMRLLLHELRPMELEREGLVVALQARLENVEERAGLETEFSAEDVGRLAPAVEEGLYRLAQEALNNALKHARATRISIRLHHVGAAVVMEIADDGIGFAVGDMNGGGLGMRGMEERVAKLGGRLSIESRPGGGTCIRVEVGS